MADAAAPDRPAGATGVLAMADGTVVWGMGIGAEGHAVGEVCFNTAMTGYQEAMTDPSYAGQIITFTTPHIGNTGANPEDVEATNPHALGCIVAASPSEAASWRATATFDTWLKSWGRIGLAGVDTRAITRRIRDAGAPNAVIAHAGERRVRRSRAAGAGSGVAGAGRDGPRQGRVDDAELRLGRRAVDAGAGVRDPRRQPAKTEARASSRSITG